MSMIIVFPTCVGVFLLVVRLLCRGVSLPHVRGGVSAPAPMARLSRRSSPRAWGCFCSGPDGAPIQTVFPTCVGVFRRNVALAAAERSLPHVRGGVSLPACMTVMV